jgi:hypothetical protein
MKKSLSIFAWLVSVLLVSGMLTLGGLYLLTRPSMRVIQTWKQPDSIRYDDGATHYLSVVENDLDWHGFPVYVSRRYFVYVGQESGTPTHGHTIDFTFYPVDSDVESYIRQSSVSWMDEGVNFKTFSGDQLFVPKQMFMGGR